MAKLFSTLCAAAVLYSGTAMAAGEVERLNSGSVLPDGLPFSEIVVAKDTLYVSGMIGIEPRTFDLVEGGLAAETRQTMNNISMMLEANGYGLNNLVKCTVFLADISQYSAFNDVYAQIFEADNFPARTVVGAPNLGPNAQLEVGCIGVK